MKHFSLCSFLLVFCQFSWWVTMQKWEIRSEKPTSQERSERRGQRSRPVSATDDRKFPAGERWDLHLKTMETSAGGRRCRQGQLSITELLHLGFSPWIQDRSSSSQWSSSTLQCLITSIQFWSTVFAPFSIFPAKTHDLPGLGPGLHWWFTTDCSPIDTSKAKQSSLTLTLTLTHSPDIPWIHKHSYRQTTNSECFSRTPINVKRKRFRSQRLTTHVQTF